MLRSYLLTLYRSLVRHKLFSLLNVFGLAVGLAVFLTLTLATRYELSYDRWIPNAERTFRVSGEMRMPGRAEETIAPIPGPVLPNMQAEFPQIEAGVRLLTFFDFAVRRGDRGDYENVVFADSSFFDVFDLPLVAGDKARAIQDTTGLVLSEAMAQKYFGDEEAMGQRLTLTLDGAPRDYVVTGVLAELPENTHLKIDFLAQLSEAVLPQSAEYLDVWNATNYVTYVRLFDAADAETLNAALPGFMQRRGGDVASWMGLRLQPIADLHFAANEMGQFKPGVDRRFVYSLQIIGILTLLLAIINYVNLATARSVVRAREVGLRKVFGATREALVTQFLVEAVVVSLVSALLALALVELSLPFVNSALGSELDLTYLGADGALLILLPVAVIVGLAAGAWPALVISRFQPAAVLAASKAPGGGKGAAAIREVLVVVQFAVSIALLTCTAIVFAQADFVRRAEVGFQRQGLIVVNRVGEANVLPRRGAIVQAFRNVQGVEAITISGRYPGHGGTGRSMGFSRPGVAMDPPPAIALEYVAPDYFGTLGIRTAAGRLLDPAVAADDLGRFETEDEAYTRGMNIAINAAAAKALGFSSPREAVNQVVSVGGGPLRIVGVMEDARFGSPQEPVPPIAYILQSDPNAGLTGDETIIIRYDGDPALVTDRLEAAWRQVEPTAPFEARTVEAAMNPFYEPDERRIRLITLGAVVASLIGCLGLYGLAAFNSERRTKEIGIRKVLGASTADVFRLLIGQFLRPVIIANLIAWPAAFVLMKEWLNSYDQRIPLSPVHFAAATGLALLVALLTVCGQAFRVSRSDPGRALRYE